MLETRGWKRLAGAIAVGAAVFAAGCVDEPVAPVVGAVSNTTLSAGRPYYFHQGSPVYLEVDPSRIVISLEPTGSAEVATVLATLAARGTEVRSSMGLSQIAEHHIVEATPAQGRSMGDVVSEMRLQPGVRFASHVYKFGSGSDVFLTDRALVAIKPGTPLQEVHRLAASAGTRILRDPDPDSGRFHFEFSYLPQTDPLAAAAILESSDIVEWSTPDMITDRRLQSVPSDPYYLLQYYLKNSVTRFAIPVDINIEDAWGITTGDPDMLIAIIDDGVDFDFTTGPDWFMSGVGGWDAYCAGGGCGSASDSWNDPYGNDRHGTAVAGIIVGAHDGYGMAGIAPATRNLYVVRAFRNGLPATDGNTAIGINMAWGVGAAVINNSWGGGAPNNAITAAIDSAAIRGRNGLGAIVVFSAGNYSNRPGYVDPVLYPATLSRTIGVGAIDRFGYVSYYSNGGAALDIVAPSSGSNGGDVVSTDPFGASGANNGPGGNVDFTCCFGGTSAAAPQVSGVAALVIASHPSLTRTQVVQRILDAADPWGSATDYGHGKLNAYAAVYDAPPLPVNLYISGLDWIDTKGPYTWEAMPSGGNGSYTYQWRLRFGTGPWSNQGTAKTHAMVVSAGSDFDLEVTARSGGQSAVDTMHVANCIGRTGCTPPQ